MSMKLTKLMLRQKLDINHDGEMYQKVLLSAWSKTKLHKVSIKVWTKNGVIAAADT